MQSSNGKKYVYSFFIANTVIDEALMKLFELFDCRLEVTYTEDEFAAFRRKLAHRGIRLDKILKVPHNRWENVD